MYRLEQLNIFLLYLRLLILLNLNSILLALTKTALYSINSNALPAEPFPSIRSICTPTVQDSYRK